MREEPHGRHCPGGIDWNACPGIWRDPGRMSGAWCIDQGRVPLTAMFANLGSGMTVEEFVGTFGAIKHEDVTSVLQHITKRLREGTETDVYSGIPEGGAIDWRDYAGIEVSDDGQSREWVFKGTRHRIADLFDHVANGGTTVDYCERADGVQPEDTEALMTFLEARLDSM